MFVLNLQEIVLENRSVRKFHDKAIPNNELLDILSRVQYIPSPHNSQKIRYFLYKDQEKKLGKLIRWAALLKDWTPKFDELPTDYIILMKEESTPYSGMYWCEVGIAVQTILLSAVEKEYHGCCINNFKKNEVIKLTSIPEGYDPVMIIALGSASEKIEVDFVHEGADLAYYRAKDGVHHVPKIVIEDLLIKPKV